MCYIHTTSKCTSPDRDELAFTFIGICVMPAQVFPTTVQVYIHCDFDFLHAISGTRHTTTRLKKEGLTVEVVRFSGIETQRLDKTVSQFEELLVIVCAGVMTFTSPAHSLPLTLSLAGSV